MIGRPLQAVVAFQGPARVDDLFELQPGKLDETQQGIVGFQQLAARPALDERLDVHLARHLIELIEIEEPGNAFLQVLFEEVARRALPRDFLHQGGKFPGGIAFRDLLERHALGLGFPLRGVNLSPLHEGLNEGVFTDAQLRDQLVLIPFRKDQFRFRQEPGKILFQPLEVLLIEGEGGPGDNGRLSASAFHFQPVVFHVAAGKVVVDIEGTVLGDYRVEPRDGLQNGGLTRLVHSDEARYI